MEVEKMKLKFNLFELELKNKFPGQEDHVYDMMMGVCNNVTDLILLMGVKDGTIKNAPNFLTSILSLIVNYADDPFMLRK